MYYPLNNDYGKDESFYTHTGVKLVLELSTSSANSLSRSVSNSSVLALDCAQSIPCCTYKSMLAQYVTDSLSVCVLGAGVYMSLSVYIIIKSAHSVSTS